MKKLLSGFRIKVREKAYSFVCNVMDEASILQVRDKIATRTRWYSLFGK